MVSEFLGDLAELKFVTAAITAQHGERDPSKRFATLWFDQGQVLTPKARKALIEGLQKYPVIFLKDPPLTLDEEYQFTDYVGDIWFERVSGGKTKWSLTLGYEEFGVLTKFLDKNNSEGESTISVSIRWVDSERIIYQAGLAQAKEREGEDFIPYDEL